METPISIAISAVALAISLLTAWMTLFRRGTVRMTRPAVLFFGPDDRNHCKVFLRTLLISTGQRGRIIENMYVVLTRGDKQQPFNIWVYGHKENVRGSGVFVGNTGVEANHHFLPPDDAGFAFEKGHYRVDVYAHLLGSRHRHLLFSCQLMLTSEQEQLIKRENAGLYFDWLADEDRYAPHIDIRPHDRPNP
jgi:hypothetical protein